MNGPVSIASRSGIHPARLQKSDKVVRTETNNGTKDVVLKSDETVRKETKNRVKNIVKKPVSKIDCSKEVKVNEIDYRMVSTVIESWDRKIKNIPDWSHAVGDRFLRHAFRIDPNTIPVFGLPSDTKWDDASLSVDEEFVQKGAKLIKAIDMAVSFLGPDLDLLKNELYRLGWQHIAMKALPSHWPIVGEALLSSFEDCMIGGLLDEEREAWITVCGKCKLLCFSIDEVTSLTDELFSYTPDMFVDL
jgi:Globin